MYQRILDNIGRHVQLTAAEQQYFCSLLQVKKLRKKQYLLQAGDICRFDCFVNKGCLRSFYTDRNGQEHILGFSVEDWWATDMQSFVTRQPATCDIEALEDCELLIIDYPSMQQLYQRLPQFERYARLILERSYIQLQQRIIESMSKTAEERYLDFVERYPSVYQRIPQYQVAAYLGITPEFLSKIRQQLQRK
jgi:CRP-like cAMP-binding protein